MFRFGQRRLCDAVQDAGSGDGRKRGYSKAFSAAITAASSAATPVIPPGVNPDRFYPDCTDFPGSYVCGWLYSGYPDGNLDDDRCFDYCA